jgi:hypothetical protein
MGSVIEAIVFEGEPAAAVPEGLRALPLAGGLSLLPVTSELLGRLNDEGSAGERIKANWMLRKDVAALARRMSSGRKVLYIFGETAGGPGTQEASGWQEGRLFYGPAGTCDLEADLEPGYELVAPADAAINAGLRAMGVRAAPGLDEFATIGLTRHRMTDDWLKD